MKKKQKTVQLALLLIGLFLIIATYFYYPSLNKDQTVQKDQKKTFDDNQINTFERLEYKGLYDLDKPFTVKSEKAYILTEEPDIVYMTKMHVILRLSDGRIVNITSNKGRYNKVSYDCFFEQNVFATDGETKIYAKNLNLLATEKKFIAMNDVKLTHTTGFLQADEIAYDFETKYFKVSMYDNERIIMKVVK